MTLTPRERRLLGYGVSRERLIDALTVRARYVVWWQPAVKFDGYCEDVTRGEWV
jgi:hypothetical protein